MKIRYPKYQPLTFYPVYCVFILMALISMWSSPSQAICEFRKKTEVLFFKSTGQKIVEKSTLRTKAALRERGIKVKEFADAIREIAKRDPTFKNLLEIFEKGQFTFAIDRNPNIRQDIIRQGFLNRRQTNQSDGVNSPDREKLEAMYLGESIESYTAGDLENGPKSSYVIPRNPKLKSTTTQYGQDLVLPLRDHDTWILDLDKIRKRVAFVVGDSFDRAIIGRHLGDPKLFHLNDWVKKMEGDSIQDYLLPLENDFLVTTIPFFYQRVKEAGVLEFVDVNSLEYQEKFKWEEEYPMPHWMRTELDDKQPSFDEAFFAKFPELEPFRDDFLFKPYGNYVEGLIFGSLEIDSVRALVVRSQMPTPEQIKLLNQRGIEVIDATHEALPPPRGGALPRK